MIPLESNELLALVEKFAASSVLEAINQQQISLDHAQLLAVLSKEKQSDAVNAISALDTPQVLTSFATASRPKLHD